MKLIVSHYGVAAVRIVNDEVAPPRGFLSKEIIDFIAQRYAFVGRPPDAPELQGMQIISFQSGAFTLDQGRVALIGISMVGHGDIVFAANTDIADKILDDLITQLDSVFGFRYSATAQHRLYQSNVTVEFEVDLAEKIAGLKKLEIFINSEIPRLDLPFRIKRLGFGGGDVPNPQLQVQPSLEALERADFLVERRSGAPYESNRYFSSAPMRTAEHVKLLERLEREKF
jgi:hypothetical protein